MQTDKNETSFFRLASDTEYINKLMTYERSQKITIEECRQVIKAVERIQELLDRELFKSL